MSRPRTIGRYEVIRELGRGGMGVVYEARCADLPRSVALKVVPAVLATPEALARFEREALAMAKVNHPNVVRIHEVGHAAAGPFLVTSLVEGRNLEEVVRESPLEPMRAAAVVSALADALEALHGAGVLHRDLKPQNVILRPDDSPVLLDFGLARDQDARSLTETGAVLGTPAYMSPEQASGKVKVDERADVYGLGALLFACLAGRPPFSGATALNVLVAVVEREPRWPSTERDVPRALEAVCRKAMRKDPAERYPTPGEVRDALRSYLQGPVSEGRPGLGLGVAGACVAVLVAAGLWAAIAGDVAPREDDGPKTAPVVSAAPAPGKGSPRDPLSEAEPQSEAEALSAVRLESKGSRRWFAAVRRVAERYPASLGLGTLRRDYLLAGLEHPQRLDEPAKAPRVRKAGVKWFDDTRFVRYADEPSGRLSICDLGSPPAWRSLDTHQHLQDVGVDRAQGRLLFRGADAGVRVFTPGEVGFKDLLSLPENAGAVSAVAMSPVDGRLAFGTYTGKVILIDLYGAEKKTVVAIVHESRINQLCFSADGRWLLSAGLDSRVGKWDLEENLHVKYGMFGPVRALAVHPDGKRFAVASGSFGITLHPLVTSAAPAEVMAAKPEGANVVRAQAHSVDPRALAFSADGTRLYSVAGEETSKGPVRGEVTVWDVAKHRPLAPIVQRPDRWFNSMDLSPDGRRLITIDEDGVRSRVEIWDVDPLPSR